MQFCNVLCFMTLCGCLVVKQFQEYVEPGSDLESMPQRRNPEADEESIVLPLGDNTLTHNLGIPVLVVCTKVGHGFFLMSCSVCVK